MVGDKNGNGEISIRSKGLTLNNLLTILIAGGLGTGGVAAYKNWPTPWSVDAELNEIKTITISNRESNIEQSAILDDQNDRLGNLERMHIEAMSAITVMTKEFKMYADYEKHQDERTESDIAEIKSDVKDIQKRSMNGK